MTKSPKETICIINKNTAYLRDFLERIGYTYAGKDSEREGSFIYCTHGNYYITNQKPSRGEPILDFHDNVAMFKLAVIM